MFCGLSCFLTILIIPVKSELINVRTKQGTVTGSRQSTVFEGRLYYAFYGVSYAKPPIGRLRFKNPIPPDPWPLPFDASVEFHGACAQPHVVHKKGLFGVEDCLYLNIFTPLVPDTKKLTMKAVIVWIHGYAFTSSFSHIYGPDFLIDNDVVLVTVNHRVGVFGFLKVNETDTNVNMGLKDIIRALKWIKRNIIHFGGDKKKITVMGSSSGATFLSLLLTTKYKRLFSKMILHSGSIFSPSIFQGDHKEELLRLKNKIQTISKLDLINASPKDIISASLKIYSNKEVMNFQRPVVPFSPIIESVGTESNKTLLTKHPVDFYKNIKNVHDIPLLIGFNTQESISEVIPFLRNPHFLKSMSTFFKFMVPYMAGMKYNYTSNTYKKISETIKNKYFKKAMSSESLTDFMKYVTDLHVYPVVKFIDTYLNGNKNLYVYKFNYVGLFNAIRSTALTGVDRMVNGSATGDELCYIFLCEPLWETYAKVRVNFTHPDKIFIQKMAQLWANFAKVGNPTPTTYTGDVKWLPMTPKEDNVMLLAKEMRILNFKPEKRMYAFWNKLFEDYYSRDPESKHDEF